MAYNVTGLKGYLQKLLARLHLPAQPSDVRAWESAQLFARLGDKESAFATLQKASKERLLRPVGLRASPLLDKLRDDPRYVELLRHIGLKA